MRTVYIDELFLLNAVVNYILLLATRRIVRLKSSQPRLMLGSIIGAVYAIFMFLPHNKIFYCFFAKFIFSLSLVAVTYNIKKFKQYIKAVAMFYMVSFAFGGAAYAFLSLAGRGGASYLPLKILATSTVTAYCCIMLLSSYCRRMYLKERSTGIAAVTVNGKTQDLKCFMDTGNNLYDPVSESPVMIVEYKSVSSILPPEIRTYLKNGTVEMGPGCFKSRLRFIPYSTIGKKNGVILGFKPDRVVFGDRVVYDIVIGLCENDLSTDDSYAALANPHIFGGAI